MRLESYGNDKYILLKYFFDHQQSVNDELLIVTNKQVVADFLHFRKDKVIKLMNECLEDGVIERAASRGKYRITEKGNQLISLFMDTEL